MIQIEMEARLCVNCGNKFKVMTKSNQIVCSTACNESGMRVHGGRRKELSENERRTESINVACGQPTRPSEPLNAFLANVLNSSPAKKKKINNETGGTTLQTERLSTLKGLSGREKTKPVNLKPKGETTTPKNPTVLQPSTAAETEETQPESSDVSLKSFGTEGFHSVNLLKKSANRLMDLMETCVSDTDLQKAQEGVQNLEMHKVEMAIRCANGIQQSVQTQVNILKAAKDLVALGRKKEKDSGQTTP